MAQRDDLLRAVQAARNGTDLAVAVAALDAHDRHRTASLQQARDVDLSAADVRRTLDPLPAFERHTAATDWLEDYEAPSDYRTAMIAEASQWYRGVPREVLADREEFEEQALGHAFTAASQYGELALPARREFMSYIGYLTRSAASGLPQIQQEIDPNNAPAETPLPTQVFDNFAPEQNEYNGVEGDNHDSQISSQQAPGIQTLESQDAGGSGFGSGPERPDVHSTSMDTADSYAEVPLGPPGQIPAATAGPAPSAPSTPNPIAGENMDEGSEQRPTAEDQQRQASYTRPDHEGFHWRLTAAAGEEDSEPVPFHAKCGSLHWPDEACGNGQAHTASMAIGYVTNAEDFYRRAHFENMGAAEGRSVLRAVGTDLSRVAKHHNTLISSFKTAARTEDEVAWLRGYMARVRPVLAGGGLQCEGCGQSLKPGKTGKCKNCKTAARSGLDFQIAAEAALTREGASWEQAAEIGRGMKKTVDQLADVTRAKGELAGRISGASYGGPSNEGLPPMTVHDMRMHLWKTHGLNARSLSAQERAHSGSVDELLTHLSKIHRKDHGAVGAMDHPHGQIDRSIVGTQPSHGVKGQDKKQLPGSLTQPDPRQASMQKGAPFAGYKDFADCVSKNSDKESPEAYCGSIKHKVEGASSLPQIQQTIDATTNAPTPQDDQLNQAVMFPLNPGWVSGQGGEGGEDEDKQAKQAARRSMTPSSAAAKMFGHMDALEGKSPHHKDNYPFSSKAHGQYIRGYAKTRGVRDGLNDVNPMNKATFHDATGRGDLHGHYLDAFNEAKASLLPGGYNEVKTSSLQRTADTLTRPHQSTDDDHPPFNTPATTPDPYSSNEGGGDFAAGKKEGAEDRANGEKPTFSDNSSKVSPYVQGYAQGYFSGAPSPGPLDTPHSIGGDSGQAMNAAEAGKEWQVAQASRRTAQERPWSSEPGGYRADDDDDEGSGNRHDDSGYESDYGRYNPDGSDNDPGGRHSSSRRQPIRVSAAFVTREAAGNPDFRKAYKFAARWTRGMPLVRRGSAAFEAGLYAGMADRQAAIQDTWTRTHQRQAAHYPEMADRMEAHASFSRKVAAAPGRKYRVSGSGYYLVRILPKAAATSVDLITDGPGTSPDPMGSTPLNGPGQAPPMGGQEDPAASGGPPPYQTVEPAGHGPVAPDDVLGTPQAPPSESGPFTQTYSGRHPGNIDLAPVAPNLAGGAGYSNADASQGDPQHKHQQAMAFRRKVQASLAARRTMQSA